MKWFFALNEACPTFSYYADMIKVAVHSALKNTSLVPYFLYDGADGALTDWLQQRRVRIISCRSSVYEKLRLLSEQKQNPDILQIGAGAFLRTELPRIAHQMGIEDSYVLYTDCDVLFIKEVTEELNKMDCRYFAVAPEVDPQDYQRMNTGVMLMNLKNLRVTDPSFRDFMTSNLEKFSCWDQSAYQWFYKRPRRRFFFKYGWDRLPIEFNWKPYWGDYSSAKIVHFHGPKPFQRAYIKCGEGPKILKDLASGSYDDACALWERMLEEADNLNVTNQSRVPKNN